MKAFGYGHGPVRVAEAALAGGATWLGVALVEEGEALRRAGITEPVLVLSEPRSEAMATVVQADLRPAIYTLEVVEAAAKAAAGLPKPLPVHLKVDTGMHRVGASPEMAVTVAEAIASHDELDLEGVWTHLAVADERDRDDYTTGQLERFSRVLDDACGRKASSPDMVHAANSAGAIAHGTPGSISCGAASASMAWRPAWSCSRRAPTFVRRSR